MDIHTHTRIFPYDEIKHKYICTLHTQTNKNHMHSHIQAQINHTKTQIKHTHTHRHTNTHTSSFSSSSIVLTNCFLPVPALRSPEFNRVKTNYNFGTNVTLKFKMQNMHV